MFYFKPVILEMFVRMVVLFLFHLGCAEKVNEEIFKCDDQENCIKFCCNLEIGDDYCGRLVEVFKTFRNSTLSTDDEMKRESFCQKVQFINGDELNSEVNDPD